MDDKEHADIWRCFQILAGVQAIIVQRLVQMTAADPELNAAAQGIAGVLSAAGRYEPSCRDAIAHIRVPDLAVPVSKRHPM